MLLFQHYARKMFASLKKKIQEEGGTSVVPGAKQISANTLTGVKATSGHSVNAQGSGRTVMLLTYQ